MSVNSSVTVGGYTIKYSAASNGYVTITIFSNSTSKTVAITQGADVNTVISTAVNQIQRDVKTGSVTSVDADTLTSYLNSSGVTDLNNLVSQAAPTAPPPTPPPPTTPATTPTTTPLPPQPPPSSANTLTGPANSDSGSIQKSSSGTTPKSPAAVAGAGGATPNSVSGSSTAPSKPQSASSSKLPTTPNGYQFQASIASTQQVAQYSAPGKRLKNPLGEFPTYTYQLSLYMITPDAYEAFVTSGRTKIDIFNDLTKGTGAGGAFLIAQSGGINNTTTKRMPGFEFDYGIDNLEIRQAINAKATQDANTISAIDLNFQISEPYGFSLIQKLKKANDLISAYSGGPQNTPENGTRQFFILGIRFFGYNTNGIPAKPTDKMSYNGNAANQPNVDGMIDPLAQNGVLFEHFYDIVIKTFTFKLDGRMIVYNIEAANAGTQAGFSIKRGTIKENTPITASTVAEMLDKLIVKINNDQKLLADQKKIQYPNTCEIVWMPGTQPIIDATMVSDADKDKSKSPGSGATSTKDVTVANEVSHQTASVGVAQTINFPYGMNIMAAINQVIAQSSYINDALKVIYTTALESSSATKSPAEQKNPQPKNVSWFSCYAQIKTIKWDSIVNDWAYEMQYIIQKYETPVVDSAYVFSGKSYPGAHKRYEYWYTGKNSEILHYEQTYDNLFFNVAVAPDEGNGGAKPSGSSGAPTPTSGTTKNTAIVPGLFTSQPRLGKTGDGMEATNNYTTSLYDPNSYSQVRMSVLGDPDYLMQEPSFSEQVVYDKVYGTNGFNINPGGGQIFVEVDFKEAIDYENQFGTLSINESINFLKYPPEIAEKIKGIAFILTDVSSKFRGGSFTQDLTLILPPFANASASSSSVDSGRPPTNVTPNNANNGSPPGNTTQSSGSTGTKADPTFNSSNPTTVATNTNNQTPAQGTTPTGANAQPVANDDSHG
jgi:hypothetical protein